MRSHLRLSVCLLLVMIAVVQAGEAVPAKMLDNGLQVIVIENRTVPLATITIAIRSGSMMELPEENGLVHLHTHMLLQASQSYPLHEAYLDRLRELGIVMNGGTEEEWVYFRFSLPADSLQPGLEFVSESMMYPMFTGDDLERVKQAVLDEMDRLAGDLKYQLTAAAKPLLWGRQADRKDFLGDRRIVQSATLEQIRLIQERYVIPNNVCLVVSGAVKPRDVFRLAKAFFGDWTAGPDPSVTNPIPPFIPLEANADTVVIRPVNTARILMAWHGPSVTADVKGTFAGDVFSFILNQKTSRFQKNLVDAGIAFTADIVYYTQEYIGPIYVSATCSPQKFWQTLQALQEEVEKFDNPDYFTDEQLANAKTLLAVSNVVGKDQASYEALVAGFWWAHAGLDYYRSYLDNLKAVTRQDISNYLQRYIIGKPHVTAAMVSRLTQQQLNVVEGRLAE